MPFFASRPDADRWLRNHPHVRGQVITTEDAIVLGRAVFGDVSKGCEVAIDFSEIWA